MNDTAGLKAFLAVCEDFYLGELPTEQPHPKTLHLSVQVREDTASAVHTLQAVDTQALKVLREQQAEIASLTEAMQACWRRGARVFLAGCGATGRLSLALETILREVRAEVFSETPVVAFMAGGDAALIRSIEAFEDHPEYGARQLEELGFSSDDLFVGITEGGETPHVIGATEHAIALGSEAVWFCYCNPDAVLCKQVARSQRVIANKSIRKLNLTVGPMVISGSTRMQASTVQMAAVGVALLSAAGEGDLEELIEEIEQLPERFEPACLASLIQHEYKVYSEKGYMRYETEDYGISVLTDTTERSPTFSLAAFENTLTPEQTPSLCTLTMSGAQTSEEAWVKLLGREPRCLEWDFCAARTSRGVLLGYDISATALRANQGWKDGTQRVCRVFQEGERLVLDMGAERFESDTAGLSLLGRHLLLKLILNTHSTLVMGLLGRYEGNLMTWVRPSNFKLIDRTIRYIQILAERRGMSVPSYEDCAREVFALREELGEGEPVVLHALERLKN